MRPAARPLEPGALSSVGVAFIAAIVIANFVVVRDSTHCNLSCPTWLSACRVRPAVMAYSQFATPAASSSSSCTGLPSSLVRCGSRLRTSTRRVASSMSAYCAGGGGVSVTRSAQLFERRVAPRGWTAELARQCSLHTHDGVVEEVDVLQERQVPEAVQLLPLGNLIVGTAATPGAQPDDATTRPTSPRTEPQPAFARPHQNSTRSLVSFSMPARDESWLYEIHSSSSSGTMSRLSSFCGRKRHRWAPHGPGTGDAKALWVATCTHLDCVPGQSQDAKVLEAREAGDLVDRVGPQGQVHACLQRPQGVVHLLDGRDHADQRDLWAPPVPRPMMRQPRRSGHCSRGSAPSCSPRPSRTPCSPPRAGGDQSH